MYLPEPQKDLIRQGYHLLEHVNNDRSEKFDDYSFLVFPFAKAYEGFLKEIFLDAGLISRKDYLSKHFRIGRVMSPNLRHKLKSESVYEQICDHLGCKLADRIWDTWKNGRNQVFHYFPENLQSLSLREAEDIIDQIMTTMTVVVEKLPVKESNKKLSQLSMAEAQKYRE